MSLPRYPQYKDSGVAWLGEVPGHWEVISIKRLSPVRRGASPRPIDDPKYFDNDGEFSWVRIADVSACDGVLNETTQRLSELGSSLSVKMAPGELFVSIAGTVGKPCISAIKACIHDGFVYFPTLQINPKFLYRIFEAGTCYGGLGKWGTQLNLNTDTIGSIRVALPPPNELNQILEFLDRETAKIDSLVAEQRRLMELLKEKRQAVISHAVTRGLNPDAPLKPSGIKWLGDVPEHWVVGAVKRFFVSYNSRRVPLSGEERSGRSGEFPYYGASGIIDFVDEFIFDEDLVLVSEDGANLLSRTTPISFVATGQYWVNNHAHILKPPDSNLIFWAERIQSIDLVPFVTGSAQPKLTSEALNSLMICAPPCDAERAAIQTYIQSETAKLDTLTAEAQRAIALLQERRTALISAAVTGQIDVRSAELNTHQHLA